MKIQHLLYFMILIAGITACEKIIAKDITGKTPVLIIPVSNDTIAVNPVQFKWQEMEGASKYHLMVVSPSFTSISSYVLDTMVTGTEFFASLDSNEYELKLAGVNGGYVSDTLGPIKFWVGVQPSSTGGNVVLTSPVDSAYVNGSFNQQFQWNAYTDATSYEISIRDGSTFSTGTILDAQNNIATTIYTGGITFYEGAYTWGVKAYLSSGGETVFSTNILYVDLTNPNQATLVSPADFSFVTQGLITFTWSNGTDPGTINAPVNSLLEIASDAAFSSIVSSTTVQGNTTDVNLSTGTYYWRVSNTDDAGNSAASSAVYQLTLN